MSESDPVQRIVDQWAVTRPDLDAAPILIVGRIARLHHGMDAALRPTFAEHGLGNGDFDVLAALRRAGEPCALRPADLSRTLLVTTGAISKRIDRLEARGHVTRVGGVKDDARGKLVRLTRRGRNLVDRLIPVHLANERRLLDVLSSRERTTLARLLAKLDATLPAEDSDA